MKPLPEDRICRVPDCNDKSSYRLACVEPDGMAYTVRLCGKHTKSFTDSPHRAVITTTPLNRKE